jgi:hypothetical protein
LKEIHALLGGGQLNVVHNDGGIFKAAPTVSNVQVDRKGPKVDVRTLG